MKITNPRLVALAVVLVLPAALAAHMVPALVYRTLEADGRRQPSAQQIAKRMGNSVLVPSS